MMDRDLKGYGQKHPAVSWPNNAAVEVAAKLGIKFPTFQNDRLFRFHFTR